MTDSQLARRKDTRRKVEVKELKQVGLVGKEPSNKPSTAWTVLCAENSPGPNAELAQRARENAEKYKNLSAAEREVRLP